MLPDYPDIKKMIGEAFNNRLKMVSVGAPFNEVSRQTLFEGHRHKIIRNDGSISDTEFKEVSSEISISLKNYDELTYEDILKKIDDCAFEMRKQMHQQFYLSIEEAIGNAGNVVDCKGGELNAEHVFESFEKIFIDFNLDGTPRLPTLIGGTKIAKQIEQVFETIENTPDLKKRMDEIISRKRIEWRDRENSRKLVG